MTERKFHKTVLQVEILSEEAYRFSNLQQVYLDITSGDCSGMVTVQSTETLDGQQAVKALEGQDSDPGFFRLNDKGEDIDE